MRPRLLIVSLSLAVGGTERHIAAIAPWLQSRGFDVTVALLLGRGELADGLEAKGVRVVAPQAFGLLLGAPRLLVEMLLRRPAIVHCFLPLAYLTGASLALLLGIPVRVMSRRSQNDYQAKHPRLARLERWLHGRMSAVLANSGRVFRELLSEGVPAARLHLVHNGIDLARFERPIDRAAVRARLGVPGDALVLAIVANLIPYKGHSDLLAALARCRLPAPWRLLVIGRDDGIGDRLRREAEDLGLARSILWLGQRSDVPDLLGASDLGLLVSHEEGFSNAVIECMAAGLPVIVTDVGGNAEAIGKDEAGVVVPPRDPDRLARAIAGLAGDPSRAVGLGAAGRERAARLYSLDACGSAYGRLYRELLRAEAPR